MSCSFCGVCACACVSVCVGAGVTDDCIMLSEQSERSVVLVSRLGAYISSPVSRI